MAAVAAALERHGEAFANQPGYVAEMTLVVEAENGSVEMKGTLRDDMETGEQFTSFVQTFDEQSVTVEQYMPAGSDRGQQCLILEGECQRPETISADEMRDADDPLPWTGQASFSSLPRFTDEGMVDTEVGRLHKYVADGVEALPPDSRSTVHGTVTDFHMELLFDEQTDLLRKFVLEQTVERNDGRVRTTRIVITYTEFGDVTIEEPDWYEG